MLKPVRSSSVAPAPPPRVPPLLGRGWDLYLIAAVLLVPILTPSGPLQTAGIDVVNGVALVCFVGALLVRGLPLNVPFLVPVLAIATGSLLALTGARSLESGVVAIVQDLYLYLWFIVLVTLMSRRGDLVRLRVAWVVAADAVALASIVAIATGHSPGLGTPSGWRDLLPSSDFRPSATFINANQFGSYLMMSVFVALGLIGRVGRGLLVASLALIAIALMATKSNGALIATAAGLATWVVARAWQSRLSTVRVAGYASLALAALLLFGWAGREWNVAGRLLSDVEQQTFVGRVAKSAGSRQSIWKHLERAYDHSPLGIGPGNTSQQIVRVGEQVRRPEGGLTSKEAHSDYLAYAAERGPIGILGLLAFLGLVYARVLGGRRWVEERTPRGAAPALWAACLAALVAATVHSTVIEALHFRHLWLALALVCSLTAPREAAAPAAMLRVARTARRGTAHAPSPLPTS